MSKAKKDIKPKGLHPFEEEFFENNKPELETMSNFFDYKPMLKGDYKEAPNLTPLSLVDIDFSDISNDDFKSGLKKLDARVNSQQKVNAKLKEAQKLSDIVYRRKPRPKVDDRMHYADNSSSASGVTHNIEIPEDREVIIQGVSDKKLSPENTGDQLGEVSGGFAQGLNSYVADKVPVQEPTPVNDVQASISDYITSKMPSASQVNSLLGVNKQATHQIEIPDDREIIIEGQGKPLVAKDDLLGTVSGTPPAPVTTVTAPVPGLYSDDLNENMGPATHTIIVPEQREVLIEGVSKFIMDSGLENNEIKSCMYHKGKKLSHVSMIFNNDSALNFNIELFNPATPLQYLISTRLNLDDKITIAGGNTKYSEFVLNTLANVTEIFCAQIVVSSPYTQGSPEDIAAIQAQLNQAMFFKNKNIAGLQAIEPINIQLQRDIMQYQLGIVYFNINKLLQRPFIIDGMDTLTYNIMAGMTVTICFYYKQISLKRVMLAAARNAPNLL